ncbi:MAG TPA: phosphodiester glycosidase family protein, partial [Anaerolineae bacterium]
MRSRRPVRIILTGLIISVAALLIVIGGYSFWRYHRPLPDNTREALFEGITYVRDVRHAPRPLILNVVMIDLNTPNLQFFVTPGEPFQGRALRAQTTSQFLKKHALQLAINADFFTPWWTHTIFDYYPHPGDPVDVNGFASSEGRAYSPTKPDLPTLYLSRDNHAQFNAPPNEVYNAFSGNALFLERGQLAAQMLANDYNDELHPRTAVALDRTGRIMLLFVVDGRQPNYSEGVTLAELGQIIIEYGGDTA